MEIEMSSIKLISQSLSVACHVDLFNACKFAVISRRESPSISPLSGACRRPSDLRFVSGS